MNDQITTVAAEVIYHSPTEGQIKKRPKCNILMSPKIVFKDEVGAGGHGESSLNGYRTMKSSESMISRQKAR